MQEMGIFTVDSQVNSYLRGEEFDAGKSFSAVRSTPKTRTEVLSGLAHGRTVLHVGFADHSELIQTKRAEGTWLHDSLCEVAERCVGIDINSGTVEELEADGVKDIFVSDVTFRSSIPDEVLGIDFDLIILGEVLEHIGNPVDFLRAISDNFGRVNQLVVVTVPNAWDIRTVVPALRGKELVNTDHRFWFTPFTLAKVMTDSGFDVQSVESCVSPMKRPKGRGLPYWWLQRRAAMLGESLVGIGTSRVSEI